MVELRRDFIYTSLVRASMVNLRSQSTIVCQMLKLQAMNNCIILNNTFPTLQVALLFKTNHEIYSIMNI